MSLAQLERLRRRAEQSRRAGHAIPVVTTEAEARALALGVAAALEALSASERLLLFSDLQEVSAALEGRIAQVGAQLAQGRGQIGAATRGLAACRIYALNAARRHKPSAG